MSGEAGFSEFTDSESKLDRPIRLATFCAEGPRLVPAVFRFLAESYSVRNAEVARRHLKLAERLQLIAVDERMVRLTDEGRALVWLDSKSLENAGKLTPFDRAHILTVLWTSAPVQMVSVLRAVVRSHGDSLAKVVEEFVQTQAPLPWPRSQLDSALRTQRATGAASRLFEHKVSCRLNWLRQLGLASSGWPVKLTPTGDQVSQAWDPRAGVFSEPPDRMAAMSLGYRPRSVSLVEAVRLGLVTEVSTLASVLASELRMANFEEVRWCLTIQLLATKGVCLAPETFGSLVSAAWREGRIRSVLDGRSGRPGAIVPIDR